MQIAVLSSVGHRLDPHCVISIGCFWHCEEAKCSSPAVMRADVRSQDRQSERADQSRAWMTGQQAATFNVTELDFGWFVWELVGADFHCYTSWTLKKRASHGGNKVRERPIHRFLFLTISSSLLRSLAQARNSSYLWKGMTGSGSSLRYSFRREATVCTSVLLQRRKKQRVRIGLLKKFMWENWAA